MSPGRPCRHRQEGGCAIYATRPETPCRSFQCDWVRKGSSLPRGLRPDRCGVIFVYRPGATGGEAYGAWEVWPGASLVDPARTIIEQLRPADELG